MPFTVALMARTRLALAVLCLAFAGLLPSSQARQVPGYELESGTGQTAHGRRLAQAASSTTVVMPVYNATNYGDMLLVGVRRSPKRRMILLNGYWMMLCSCNQRTVDDCKPVHTPRLRSTSMDTAGWL